MKSKRSFSALLAVLALCLLVATIGSLVHNQSRANPATLLPGIASVGAVPLTGEGFGNSSAIFTVTGGTSGTSASGIYSFGTGVLTTVGTGTAAATLTSSSGTGNVPIDSPYVNVTISGGTASSVLLGSSSATCSFPLYTSSSSGTAGTQFYSLVQPTNLNQLYIKLTNSGTTTATADVELIYNQ